MKIGKLFLTAVTLCSVASLQAQSGTPNRRASGILENRGIGPEYHRFARKGDRNRVPGLGNRFDSDDRRRARVASRRCDRRQAGGCEHLCRNQGRQAVQRRIPADVRRLSGCRPEAERHQADHRDQAPSDQAEGGCGRPCRAGRRSPCGDEQTGRVYLVFEEHLRAVDSERPQRNQGGLSGRRPVAPGARRAGIYPDSIVVSATKMRAHEEWFDEARKFGLEINVWTVNDEGSMKYLIGKGVDYITTDEPELLQSLLGK